MRYILGEGDADATTLAIDAATATLACQRSKQPNDYDVDCLTKGYADAIARINELRKELALVAPGWDQPGGATATPLDAIKAAELRAKIDIQSTLRDEFSRIRNDAWRSGVAALDPATATCEQVKQHQQMAPAVAVGASISPAQQAWNKRYTECFPPDPHALDFVAPATTQPLIVPAPKPPTAADVTAAIQRQQASAAPVAPVAPRTPTWMWAAGAGMAGILFTLLLRR